MVTMMAMAVDQIPDEDITNLTFRYKCDIFLEHFSCFFRCSYNDTCSNANYI